MSAKKKIRNNRYKRLEEESPSIWGGLLRFGVKVVSAVVGIIFLSLLFVFLHDMIMQCNYFRASTVNIDIAGRDHLTSREIEQISHIKKGVNILSINLPMVRRRLLSDPWVAKAYVQRNYPSTITIRVVENQPVAKINFGHMFLINARGNVFKEVSRSDFPDLPVISGVDYLDWTGDDGSSRKMFNSVMRVLKLGRQKDSIIPDNIIEEIDVDKDIGLTVRTRSSVEEIELGYGDYAEKYKRMSEILTYLNRNAEPSRFYSMDLSNPGRIVAKPEKIEKTHTPDKKEA